MRKNKSKITADQELNELLADQGTDHEDTEATDLVPAEWDVPEVPREIEGSGDWETDALREAASAPDWSDYRGRPTRHPNPRVRATQTAVGDLVTSGHGFGVEKVSRAWLLPRNCRQCGVLLPIAGVDYDVCECSTPMDGCGCNPCTERRYRLRRKRGNQPVHCGSPECRKAENREKQRRKRARGREPRGVAA